MPKSAMIRARVEPELKRKAEDLLNRLGLNATEAITLFYRQILIQKGVPFAISVPEKKNRSPVADESARALVKKARSMTPDERLEAFYNHSFLIRQMKKPAQTKEKP